MTSHPEYIGPLVNRWLSDKSDYAQV
jgi:hypothetical protein